MVWNLLFLSAFRCLLSACNFYIAGGSTVPHRTARLGADHAPQDHARSSAPDHARCDCVEAACLHRAMRLMHRAMQAPHTGHPASPPAAASLWPHVPRSTSTWVRLGRCEPLAARGQTQALARSDHDGAGRSAPAMADSGVGCVLGTGTDGPRCGPLGTRAGSQHASAWGVRLMARGYAAARPQRGYGRSSPRRLRSAGNGAWLGTSAGVRPRARSATGARARLATGSWARLAPARLATGRSASASPGGPRRSSTGAAPRLERSWWLGHDPAGVDRARALLGACALGGGVVQAQAQVRSAVWARGARSRRGHGQSPARTPAAGSGGGHGGGWIGLGKP
jgi:hypothetical protein